MSLSPPPERSSASRHKSNRFRARSLTTAAAGLMTTTTAQMASASLVYPDPGVFGLGTSISIDGVGDDDIFLMSMTGMNGTDLYLLAPGSAGGSMSLDIDLALDAPIGMIGYLSFLGNNVSVDGSLFADSGTRGYLMREDAAAGNWQPGFTGYAGFTFNDGTQDLYGYFQLTFSDATTLQISQIVYESDSANPLFTPLAPVAIPEPGTALLLGLGLAGLVTVVCRNGRGSRETDSS